MSRTDDHRPFWVKMAESPRNYKENHNHGSTTLKDERGFSVRDTSQPVNRFGLHPLIRVQVEVCDLPHSPSRFPHHAECDYTYTSAWINSGEARCGCPLCSDKDGRKLERRKQRREGRKQARSYHPDDY